ncbi:nitrogenase-associated protein [Methyloprofundus sedimenti]|uniref:Nitrogenase-associated protein n=1 Tax=Methyloprofundus sedimenti TaxID=1420851 RepID=A0A1V8M235_9GAMM|nr:ArsC/Spx/MgsR family protein [Methyloprofundus sedimenti]OQK15605.1 nitrogenase-associated protein [Methyloprofundus sedimenti]
MAQIIFYEKPGCINNARQKKLLRAAGHIVVAKNLLTEDWSSNTELLREFFTGKSVAQWFNRSAPAIKQGLFNPETVDAEQAISLMLADPLLIRRPLMQVGSKKSAGFNEQEVDSWIGLIESQVQSDLETCPNRELKDCQHG